MNKIIKTLLVVMVVVLALTAFVGCGEEPVVHEHTGGTQLCTHPAKCDECGQFYGEAKGHTPIELEGIDATCTSEGYAGGVVCADCGIVLEKQEVVEKLPHTFDTDVAAKDATCTENGHTAHKTCSVCGAKNEDYVLFEKLGHTWGDATCTAPKTCETCGATEGEALGHTYVKGICSVCEAKDPAYVDYYLVGYINGADYGCEGDYANLGEYKFVDGKLVATFTQGSYIFVKSGNLNGENVKWYLFEAYTTGKEGTLIENKSEKMFIPGNVEVTFTLTVNEDGTLTLVADYHTHTFGDATCTAPAKCECGETQGEALGHTWADATCTAPKTCETCGTTEGEALGHAYTDGICDNCGATDPNHYFVVSIADALKKADGAKVQVSGTVVGIYQPYSSQYNNISVYIADEDGNQILLYRIPGNWDIGDKLTVKGEIDIYNGNPQIAQGGTVVSSEKHVCSEWTDATCSKLSACVVCGATTGEFAEHNYVDGSCADCGAAQGVTYKTVSKSHNDIATIAGVTIGQNTGVISNKEIKLDDNITIVCAKGSASADPCIYTESIRLYQNGATLTIKGTGMKTIVITLAANAAGDGPIAVTGGTADNANAPTNYVYTITVNEGVDEVVITTKGTDKNSRLYVANIEVLYAN